MLTKLWQMLQDGTAPAAVNKLLVGAIRVIFKLLSPDWIRSE